MGGLVEALLGAGIGASTAAVNNAKHDQQQMDADAAEQRVMNRETALMSLRNKYAKDLAEHSDGLARDRAQFENDLKLDSLNDKRVMKAEDRKRQGEIDDYDIKKMIDNDYDSQKEERANAEWRKRNATEYSQQKSLVGMKLAAAKGAATAGDVPLTPEQNAHNAEVIAARKAVTKIKATDPRLLDNGVNPKFDKDLAGLVKLAREPLYGVVDQDLVNWGDEMGGGGKPKLKDGVYKDKQGKTYQVVGGKIVAQ